MQLIINDEALRCVWGGAGEFWFSRTDCQIHSVKDLQCDNDASLVELGFIPFLTISNEKIIRAYIKYINNKKVSAVLDKLEGQQYVETFWKYFNAYPDISAGFDSFEKSYVLDKVKQWCAENSIDCKAE